LTSQATDAPITVPVKPQHSFDEARLADFLIGHVPGFEGPLTVKQFEGGQSNPTFLLETPGRSYVMRRKPPGQLARSAHAVDREYRILAALADTDVPVPRPYALCTDERVLGTVFFVMDHVPGRILRDPTLPELTPGERRALVIDYVDTLASLHNVDYRAIGLEDFGRPGNYFERQISRWGRQYQETETDPIPEMHRLLAWLEGAVPEQQVTSIVHGDYQFGNVLTHPTQPKVAAVLDWELSTIGDPLLDLGWLLATWPEEEGGGAGSIGIQPWEGFPRPEELIARYGEHSDRDLSHITWYEVLACYKLGIILEGTHARAHAGQASKDVGAVLHATTLGLFERASRRIAAA